MTEREIKNKIRSLELELEFLMFYEEDMIKEIGRNRLEREINKRLKQYKTYLELLKSLKK